MKRIIKLTALLLLINLNVWAQNTAEKPNIIWIMAEDIGHDFACYGMEAVKTPNFDKLAEDGTIYYNAFGTATICSTNRSAMMIGTHQLKTNTMHHRSNRNVELQDPFKPFTYWLKKEGYTTILGHHGVQAKGRKTDCNFKYTPIGTWEENRGLFDKHDRFEKADEPFFAQIQLNVTHRGGWWNNVRNKSEHPVSVDDVVLPPYYADTPEIRLDWAKYLDQIEYADNEMGMIVQELKEKNMLDNTIIVVIGDNGRCNLRGKGYLQDPAIRIPLIVKWAKDFDHEDESDQIIASTDITATILDLAGAELPEYLTGRSFIRSDFDRQSVYSYRGLWDEVMEDMYAVSDTRYRYVKNNKPELPYDAHQAYLEFYRPAVHVMRTLNEEGKLNDYQKIFFEDHKPVEEFYDLKNDPYELNNLAGNPEYKKLIKKYRKEAEKYTKEMVSEEDTYEPVTAYAVEVYQYVKNEFPEAYKRMQAGEEIGFGKFNKKYKAAQAKEKGSK
ncbi:sulfatase-like hydrolase/transferase [Flammeovirga kamogawensis]|uniref:Sulfatase-like hydrolase/transferase n=1 Tax=Flammeovirga kamogawensis TaxID=373891 RepID=A0ABX8GYM3_9BACT|nr:sulfatase-like hydrolase/transferase [Flammeovirga kamogawensis]MBB6459143.1 arylsulfatase A-like enzyme [Flammeovirga kamogawensis]QWG08710.1 sulfatase-like hydrolase/transferase [Flammeovirga kamogawensis]